MGGRAGLLLAFALLAGPALATPGSWERPRGDDANSGSFGPAQGGVGAEAWNVTLDSTITGSPVAALGRVLVGTEGGVFYAIDAATKTILWSARGTGLTTAAAVHDGIAFVGGQAGLYAFDVTTGRQVWSRHEAKPILATPMFSSGVLIVGTQDGEVHGLDPVSAEPLWPKVRVDGPVRAGAVPSQGTAFVQTVNGTLYGINVTTGAIVLRTAVTPGASTPALAEGLLWLTGAGIQAVDPATGLVVRNQTLPGTERVLTSAVVQRQRMWLGTDRGVVALDLCRLAQRDPLWRTAMPAVRAELTLADRFLYATDASGVTRAIEADTGREAWRYQGTPGRPDRPIAPVQASGKLYVASGATLVALEVGPASELGSSPLPTPRPCFEPGCDLPSQPGCCLELHASAPGAAGDATATGGLPRSVTAIFSLSAPYGCSDRVVREVDPASRIEFRTLAHPQRSARFNLAGLADLHLGPTRNLTVLALQVELRDAPDNLTVRLPEPDPEVYRVHRVLDLQPGYQFDAGRAGPLRIGFSTFNIEPGSSGRLVVLYWAGTGWVDLHGIASGGSGGVSGASVGQDLVVFSAGRGEGEVYATVNRPGVFALAGRSDAGDGGDDGVGAAVWISAAAIAVLLAAGGSALVLFLARRE